MREDAMSLSDVFTMATTFIFALGGGGAIVLGLSQWIGRFLADRYVDV